MMIEPPQPSNPSNQKLCEEQLESTLAEIHLMVRFLRRQGAAIPESLAQEIAKLCEQNADRSKSGEKEAPIAFALSVHTSLCRLVVPATPVTIHASQIEEGKIVSNPIVSFLLRASLASLGLFVACTVAQEIFRKTYSDTGTWAIGFDGIWAVLILLSAAGLGSGFYGLYTAHKYIVRSTFDPKYAQTYFVRFFLGLTSGVILGYFGKSLLTNGSSDDELTALGPPVLALLGGYASEAVSQILSRVAETLVTLVRGGGSDLIQAKEEELKAKNKQHEAQLKGDLEVPLREASALLNAPSANIAQVQAAITKALVKLKE